MDDWPAALPHVVSASRYWLRFITEDDLSRHPRPPQPPSSPIYCPLITDTCTTHILHKLSCSLVMNGGGQSDIRWGKHYTRPEVTPVPATTSHSRIPRTDTHPHSHTPPLTPQTESSFSLSSPIPLPSHTLCLTPALTHTQRAKHLFHDPDPRWSDGICPTDQKILKMTIIHESNTTWSITDSQPERIYSLTCISIHPQYCFVWKKTRTWETLDQYLISV